MKNSRARKMIPIAGIMMVFILIAAPQLADAAAAGTYVFDGCRVNKQIEPYYTVDFPVEITVDFDESMKAFEETNRRRKENGVSELVLHKFFMDNAIQRLAELAICYSHTSPSGEGCFGAENISMACGANYADGIGSVGSWMNSPGHRKNILNGESELIGVAGGVYAGAVHADQQQKKYTGYFVQCFFPMTYPGAASDIVEPDMYKGKQTIRTEVAVRNDLIIFSCQRNMQPGEKSKISLCNLDPIKVVQTGAFGYVPPSSMLICRSSDPSVCTVENGIVTARGGGSAEITVCLAGDPGICTVIPVTVDAPKKDISIYADIWYSPVHTETGKEICPAVTLKDNAGAALAENRDYMVSYTNNVKPGTGWITITGIGNYKGSFQVTFLIKEQQHTESTGNSGQGQGTFGGENNSAKPQAPSQEIVDIEWPQGNGNAAASGTTSTKPAKTFLVKLQTKSYTYNGKARKPGVSVYVGKKKLNKKYYKVSYKKNKNVGTAEVIVTGKGTYKGYTGKAAFEIKLKKPSKPKLSSKKQSLTIKWKKDAQGQGYQLQIAGNKKMTASLRTYNISKNKTTSYTVKKLPRKSTWYVRIRTFKKVNGKMTYSAWSPTKAVKVK